ncbi:MULTISPECIES: HNH endonuclease [Geomonas]|uniref:HNH endonuclease n=1 Tax=Geomonas TaxID=2651583 RepID=UPI00100B9876|nr:MULTISPECIES: HNH endonuclease [Geomonas]
MNHWIFQGNPDYFDIDTYIKNYDNVRWLVGQKHLADKMAPGDEVFFWRAAGKKSGKIPGIVAYGILTSAPSLIEEDEASIPLYKPGTPPPGIDLRVSIQIKHKCLGAKEIIKKDWLLEDPVVPHMRILKFFSETNYLITTNEAQRLFTLVRNTGRDWTREESIGGLWAYAQTLNSSISRLPGSPVSEVALAIGRALPGVYNKVMNFRALDPTDERKGFSSVSQTDEAVWHEFFDPSSKALLVSKLDSEFSRLWGKGQYEPEEKLRYKEFGEAPDDDPQELQRFAARVRRGQPLFRKNLLEAYGPCCVLSGHGPAEVLEAVHILPHAKSGINKLDNGLLMRADLHYLFDADLIKVNPETLEAEVDATLQNTPYYAFHGKKLNPRQNGSQISSDFLKLRWSHIKQQS